EGRCGFGPTGRRVQACQAPVIPGLAPGVSAPMSKQQLLKRLDQAWAEFRESYAGLSDADLMRPGVTGTWSVRDIIAHVTWWEEEALTHLPLVLAGGRPPRYSVTHGGIDAFNAKMTEQRKPWSLAQVLTQ